MVCLIKGPKRGFLLMIVDSCSSNLILAIYLDYCYYLDVIFKLQLSDNWSSSNEEDIPQTSWSSCDIIIQSSSGNHDNIP